ncbi:glycoside hydrolase family 16 protein [Pontibacter sp. JH31]|uniref:Glycoside hydrolase family 16 protein n=1 Tax=Pontibacter aquaedesilientis TaxID=2766980 RepID=A0ABR7XJR9_9BACT|nr:glycoside hydrolase family 16 protein [Pontibacter aquaedesilientis]MBD1397873.1 glycoside hydrolase family 16 protein [Pontibacter aquaedesilientis]
MSFITPIKTISALLATSAVCFSFAFSSCKNGAEESQPYISQPKAPQDLNWQFESAPVWADEFDYTGQPNPDKWGYDIGGTGWGNNELQFYTNKASNASVANGILKITARRENTEGKEYSSARLVTKNKGDFLYGRFEIKAKLPTGLGTWPAIWMLPTDWAYGGWPRSGEIDIMEHVGYDQNNVHITVHTEAYNHSKNTQKGKSKIIETASTAFHLYRVDWTPYAIRGYIDDLPVFEFINEGKGINEWPFDKRFHLLLNIAVGGNWGGAKGVDPSVFPQTMEVDYVRVYKMIQK